MASGEGRVSFLQRHGLEEDTHTPGDGPTPWHMQANEVDSVSLKMKHMNQGWKGVGDHRSGIGKEGMRGGFD